jgi:hypothetical protein
MVGAPVPDSTWRVRCLALDQPWEFDFSCREGFAGDIATSETVHPRADEKLTHPHVRTACVRAPVWRAEWQSRTRSPTRNATAAHMNAVIRVYDEAGNVIETHEHAGEFKEWRSLGVLNRRLCY